MYYPSYDDYMKDIFYYNGLSNNRMGYMNGGPWNNMAYSQNNMQPYMNGTSENNSNLNNLYPSIYRIVYPVVERVVSGNNFQFVNDETITNATNTIYDIVEGDISSAQNASQSSGNNSGSNATSNNTQQNSNSFSNASNSQQQNQTRK